MQAPATTPPIAVLDSGVAPVPELEGRLRQGANVISGGSSATDTDGHGTAVASVAAAAAGGVRGVSPTSPIIPVKVFDARGETSAAWVIAGIRRAVALGAGVINLSAAGPATGTDPATNRVVQSAIFDAISKGVLVISPTGNEGAKKLDIPASYPHVLAVGATDASGLTASFSNTGAGIDLVAPGDGITTAAPQAVCGSGYAYVSGTSFSSPAVAGAAAVLEQLHPGLDTTQLTNMLRLAGASPVWSGLTGFGTLNVPAVLAAPVPPPDAPEVDDTIAWAKRHPVVLPRSKRSRTIQAHVATHSDPADVFRVALKRGDRLTATVSSGSTRLPLSIQSASKALASGGGKARTKVSRAGEYYVMVKATRTPVAGVQYSLTLKRN